ncbi:MAG TPA: hypothetical protein VEG68_17135 [Terriglobales bacterium]|nr:hypothetical protein [Terriglobales bacterium]
MTKTTIFLMVLCAALSVTAQTNQSSTANQQSSKKAKDEVTVRGCLGKLSTDYILTQPDQGNSYELQGMRFARYLGQEVEVSGVQSPSLSTSSDFLARSGSASPVTITVKSIKTIAKRCSD